MANGNRRGLTKAEIAERQKAEGCARSGKRKLTASAEVLGNPVSAAMHGKLKKLYRGMDVMDALDDNIVNRYCMMCAEMSLHEGTIMSLENDLTQCETILDKLELLKIMDKTTRNIHALRTQMLQIEDRIFLNPVARIKNVPKKENPKGDNPNAHLFA